MGRLQIKATVCKYKVYDRGFKKQFISSMNNEVRLAVSKS